MEEGRKEQDRKMAKIIARVWSDESFKKHLLSNPLAVLQSMRSPYRKVLK
jgi:hypothetical protein